MIPELLQLGSIIYPAPTVRVTRKLRVYTLELNVVMGKWRYLPYSTGLLRAYVEADPVIQAGYSFQPFLYEMESLPSVLARFTVPPDVLCVSLAMWNERLSLKVAGEIKHRYPQCLIIFGGCHTPHHPKEYMEQYPFIDLCIRSEGEEAFREVLLRNLESRDFSNIPQVSFRKGEEILEDPRNYPFNKNLDQYPSPYTTGLFDEILADRKEDSRMYQAIVETNRGCPFDCSFLLLGGWWANDQVSFSQYGVC